MAAGGMGRKQVNGDLGHDAGPEGGLGQAQHVLSDDMLYKLSKKIAQLTKVIYSLNTKNDDLEFDMDALRKNYEEKLEKVSICQTMYFCNFVPGLTGKRMERYQKETTVYMHLLIAWNFAEKCQTGVLFSFTALVDVNNSMDQN